MTENQENTRENKPKRDKRGRLLPGYTANPHGQPKLTEEKKLLKRTMKEFVADYKQKLAESLPFISPVLIDKATKGDIQAIKEINDRVMGKAPQTMDVKADVSDNLFNLINNALNSKSSDTISGESKE